MVPELLEQARGRGFHLRTPGGDKGYDTRHTGYALSQRIRKRVEEIFGWMKTVGGFRRTRYRGLDRTGLAGNLVATAYNLVRMAKLLGQAAATPEARMA